LKLWPAKIGIHVSIQQAVAAKNQLPGEDDQTQIERVSPITANLLAL
jgi:hypothetical protein